MRRRCHCMAEATAGNTTHRACAWTVLTTLSATSAIIFIFEICTARSFEYVQESLCVPPSLHELSGPGTLVSRTVTVVTHRTE